MLHADFPDQVTVMFVGSQLLRKQVQQSLLTVILANLGVVGPGDVGEGLPDFSYSKSCK